VRVGAAADILRSYYRGNSNDGDLEIKEKKDGPVTAADIAANHSILEKLQTSLGTEDFGYLSEETYKSLSEESRDSLIITLGYGLLTPSMAHETLSTRLANMPFILP
jgi:3'(2'), 5'-bisphosphate nucleotidase